ncbi:MAG: gamma-glutamylcyclotransferase [Terracidiphilus sp.]
MTQYLLAYGTLQPGLAPAKIAPLAAKLRPVGEGFIRGTLYDLGRYAGAVPDPASTSRIAGTVMELPEDESFLHQLDGYEGFDPSTPETSEYIRERQTVELSEGGTLECWIYSYNRQPEFARRIADDGGAGARWQKRIVR